MCSLSARVGLAMCFLIVFVSLSFWSTLAIGGCSGLYLVICEDRFYDAARVHAWRVWRYHPCQDSTYYAVLRLRDIEELFGSRDSTTVRAAIRYSLGSGVGRRCARAGVLIIGQGVPSYRFIPSKAALKKWHRWISYDDPYGDVDDDGRLDFPVARICPATPQDLMIWSDKVLEMLLSEDPDEQFHRRVLILAEDGRINGLDGGYVRSWARKLEVAKLPDHLDKLTVYATDIDPDLDPQVLQDYILPIFNQGHGIVIGIGTYASVFDFVDFFSTKYANLRREMLTNQGKYPVMLGFSCEIARWDTTAEYARITDVFNFARSAGSVLCIGPTGVTMQAQSKIFLDAFLDSLLSRRYGTWGEAFVAAKNGLQFWRFDREIWWEYGLFGEPTLPIRCAGPPTAMVATGEDGHRCKVSLSLMKNPTVVSDVQIRLLSSSAGRARVSIYNIMGRLVQVLHDGRIDAGETVISWDCKDEVGRRVSPGIYFVRCEAGGSVVTSKLVILR